MKKYTDIKWGCKKNIQISNEKNKIADIILTLLKKEKKDSLRSFMFFYYDDYTVFDFNGQVQWIRLNNNIVKRSQYYNPQQKISKALYIGILVDQSLKKIIRSKIENSLDMSTTCIFVDTALSAKSITRIKKGISKKKRGNNNKKIQIGLGVIASVATRPRGVEYIHENQSPMQYLKFFWASRVRDKEMLLYNGHTNKMINLTNFGNAYYNGKIYNFIDGEYKWSKEKYLGKSPYKSWFKIDFPIKYDPDYLENVIKKYMFDRKTAKRKT